MVKKNNKFDIAIVGAGIAGCFAALKFAEKADPSTRIVIFDIGREFGKRRRQLEGALGVFPNSDGKLFMQDLQSIKNFGVDGRTVKGSFNWVSKQLELCGPLKLIEDKGPSKESRSRIDQLGLNLTLNDYYQWKPEYVHKFSKYLVSQFENNPNIVFSFDNEVNTILKKKGDEFLISSDNGDYLCKNLIIAVGRTGFRWVTDFYKEMGMEISDDVAKFGVRFELGAQYMKDFADSTCQMTKETYSIYPLSWNGTVIPVDHADLVCSGFRSNEDRWYSEKVSFGLAGHRSFPKAGVAQVERIANLTYLLYNDRVSKEKVKVFLKGNSQLNLIKEFDWLKDVIHELNNGLIEDLIAHGTYHIPYIVCEPGKINVNDDLSTEIKGMYVAGECGGIKGMLGAAVSGSLAMDSILKGQ